MKWALPAKQVIAYYLWMKVLFKNKVLQKKQKKN